ncbi:MAG: glycosyltransferase [Burkholderiales bacterium]|jgi:glycosyltransferase involved in cell wall biosynthesis|nr:MAG: glycosyltransferase [Burkholderiales bacterium]
MKILVIAVHFAEYATNLALELARTHSVRLIVNGPNFDNEIDNWPIPDTQGRLEIFKLRHKLSPVVLIENIVRITTLAREFKPDVIHIQEELKDYLIGALPFLPSAPKVLTIHDPKPHSGHDTRKLKFSRRRFYETFLRRSCQGIVIHSDRLLKEAASFKELQHAQIAVAPHGPLGIYASLAINNNWQAGRCLFFGRIEAYKGLGIFLDALDILVKRGVPIQGVIAGRGSDLEQYRQRISQSPHIELQEKFLSPDEVISEFDRANLVVLPYLDATQSGVGAYAIGRGRPMVASNVGGLGEMCVEQVNGLLVKPSSSEDLAAAIEKLVTNQDKSRAFALASRELANHQLSWAYAAQQTTLLYSELIKGEKHTPHESSTP